MVSDISQRYNIGRRQLQKKAEKEHIQIAQKIRVLREERANGVSKPRGNQIRDEILKLTHEYDAVSVRVRSQLKSHEEMRDSEILKRRLRHRYSF